MYESKISLASRIVKVERQVSVNSTKGCESSQTLPGFKYITFKCAAEGLNYSDMNYYKYYSVLVRNLTLPAMDLTQLSIIEQLLPSISMWIFSTTMLFPSDMSNNARL